MAVFTKIEIHFRDPTAGTRRVVILPNSGVQAIFLRRSENRLKFMKGVKRADDDGPPPGVILEGQRHPPLSAGKDNARGPGEVCYLVQGLLHCWKGGT